MPITWNGAGTVIYAPVGGLPDGKHAAKLTVKDIVGNTTVKDWTFTIDTTVPTVIFDGPLSGSPVNGKTPITGTVTDAVSLANYTVQFKPSDEVSDTWTSYQFLTGVLDSNLMSWSAPTVTDSTAYDIRIVAVDSAGNSHTTPVRTVWVTPSANAYSGAITKIGGYSLSQLAAGAIVKGGSINITGSGAHGYYLKYIQTYPVTGSYIGIATVDPGTSNGTLGRWNTSQ